MPSSLELPESTCGCQDARTREAPAREAPRTPLSAGSTFSYRLTVDRDRTIDFMGDEGRVYATPMLVQDIELACRDAILAHVEPGQDSDGTRVEIDHLAATPIGMAVTLDIQVTATEGRQVTFTFEGRDDFDTICRGRHLRMVVDVERTAARIAAKVARAAQAGGRSGGSVEAAPADRTAASGA